MFSLLNLDKICRVCLEEGILMSIFSEEYVLQPVEMILSCTSIKIDKNDGLPPSICTNCIYRLEISYQFKKLCENNDRQLRNYLATQAQQMTYQPQQINVKDEQTKETLHNDIENTVKDEEIYEAMNVVCEILKDSQNTVGHDHNDTVKSNESSAIIKNFPDQIYKKVEEVSISTIVDVTDEVMSGVDEIYKIETDLIVAQNDDNSLQTLKQNEHNNTRVKKKRILRSKNCKIRNQLDELLKQKNKQKIININGKPKIKKTFPTPEDDIKEMHLLKEPEQCFECGKTFNYSGYLDAHLRTHTGEKPFECSICNRKFAQTGNLALHMRIHTGERPFQCEICSKMFTTSSNLYAHQRTHSGIRNFICSLCPKAFKSSSELSSHAGTHTGVKNHICKICNKAFYKTSYLNVHMKTVHIGEKRHRCSECGKEFSNSSNLTCHFRIHTGEKPFSCKYCDARFNQSSALIRHAKQHSRKLPLPLQQTEPNISTVLNTPTNCDIFTANMDDNNQSSISGVINLPSTSSVITETINSVQLLQIPSIQSLVTDYSKSTISHDSVVLSSEYMKLSHLDTHPDGNLGDFTKPLSLMNLNGNNIDYMKNMPSVGFDYTKNSMMDFSKNHPTFAFNP